MKEKLNEIAIKSENLKTTEVNGVELKEQYVIGEKMLRFFIGITVVGIALMPLYDLIFGATIAICAAVGGIISICLPKTRSEINFNQALRSYDNEEIDKVIIHLEKSIKYDSNNETAHKFLEAMKNKTA